MTQWIEEWIVKFLHGPSYAIGNAIWNLIMELVTGLMEKTPQQFSTHAWAYAVAGYQWSLGIGLAMMNTFFLIGFFRQTSNLRENVTWEILIEYLIKAIMANALMTSGLKIIQEFFNVAGKLCGELTAYGQPPFSTENLDFGSWLFFAIFGVLYVIVAVVCGFLMLMTVYGRYLKLYILTILGPIAMSTWAGGRGMEQSFYAWMKTFLASVFEIVLIALVMGVGGMMIASIDFGTFPDGILSMGDGFLSVLQNMFTMILMSASVKGADTMLKRAFAL